MKIAYIDTIAGISGDMTLGAFVNSGVSLDELIREVKKLPLSGFELQERHVERNGIVATKIDVDIQEEHQPHRHLSDIYSILDQSDLSVTAKDRAKRVFRHLAEGEARVHNTSIDRVHFHEVGAVDALIDVVGTVVCLELLGIDRLYSSPVKVGRSGFVHAQHGVLPVPTPATMEILKGYPISLTAIEAELTTPTGAAIIKALSSGVLSEERILVDSIGYGAGTRELKDLPNLLRIMIGALDIDHEEDRVVTIETNIDDMTPELYPYVIEKLLEAGSLDAYIIPVIMKKGRPGVLLSALAAPTDIDRITSVIFRETSTLGVRMQSAERKKLQRREQDFVSSFGPVKVKGVVRDGKEVLIPEYEECRRIALERGVPLREVYAQLERELRS